MSIVSKMVEREFPEKFQNLDEKWRGCALCGQQMYPELQLTFVDGIYLCSKHYNFRYRNKAIDDYRPDVSDLKDE